MDFDESWPMPTERMEVVEVVCGMCKGEGETEGYPGYAPQGGPDGARSTCFVCQGAKALTAEVPEGSLTAARLRLADAAEAYLAAVKRSPSLSLPDAVAASSKATRGLMDAGNTVTKMREVSNAE